MKFTRQPSPKELFVKEPVYATHVFNPVDLPKEGIKFLQLLTELHNRPGLTYAGMSFRRPIDSSVLENMLETNQVFEIRPIRMDQNTRIYVTPEGVVRARNTPHWPNDITVGTPKELNLYHRMVKDLQTKPTPYHTLPDY